MIFTRTEKMLSKNTCLCDANKTKVFHVLTVNSNELTNYLCCAHNTNDINDKCNMTCFTQMSSKTKTKTNIFFVDKTQKKYCFISCEADAHYYWERICVII